MSNEKPKPNYDGDRKVILPGNLPALKPIKQKEPVEPSPKLAEADQSASLHKGLENASRRIKIVQSLDILLQHNADLIEHFESEVARCKANSAT